MPKHNHGDVHSRYEHLPEGFIPWKKGSDAPPEAHPGQLMELMIRTSEGFGSSGIRRAQFHCFEQGDESGLGEVVGYKLIGPSDLIRSRAGEPIPHPSQRAEPKKIKPER